MRWIAAIIGILLCFVTYKASGQDHHHPLHKDFYQKWRDPTNPQISCCNARLEGPDGTEVGDCEPTLAIVVKGRWVAWVRQIGDWVIIPDNKILRERNPNGQDAHLCWTQLRGVICFVPPDVGG